MPGNPGVSKAASALIVIDVHNDYFPGRRWTLDGMERSPTTWGGCLAVAGANVPDGKLVAETLDAIPLERPEPTPQKPQPSLPL
jgi:nicotinamidase-related amidase